ncbi:MAG: universal stress protein [Alphaproteobacteria bacterium]|jgi:nucleotide-binding universal stress UspA family protein|nr:universal stress protein [Alphaproteobacteria bacterium]
MAVKVIMVAVSAVLGDEQAMRTALGLAARFGSHVEVLHVRSDPRVATPYMGEGMSGAAIQEIMEVSEQDEVTHSAQLRALFDSLCSEQKITLSDSPGDGGPDIPTAEWREEVGQDDDIVAARGRLADLVVVARPDEAEGPTAHLIIEAALFESGRPVLIVPPSPPPGTGERVAVAWNGSLEASRAVAAAMPVLRGAEEVIILWAREKTGDKDGKSALGEADDLVRYLAWNGIAAEARCLDAAGKSEGGVMLAEVAAWKADLLVMGGYTHSRFRQMLFGGVTRHILTDADVPVLMAH